MLLKRLFEKKNGGEGGNIGSTYAEGRSGIAYRVSTRGEGGKKRPKNCVRTMCTRSHILNAAWFGEISFGYSVSGQRSHAIFSFLWL